LIKRLRHFSINLILSKMRLRELRKKLVLMLKLTTVMQQILPIEMTRDLLIHLRLKSEASKTITLSTRPFLKMKSPMHNFWLQLTKTSMLV
jgi:hypothetical protein